MKKVLVAFVLISCVFGGAQAKFKSGDNGGCYVDTSGNDWFWFCGTQKGSCAGSNVWKKNRKWNFQNKGYFDWNNTRYFCCLKPGQTTGRFVAGSKWEIEVVPTRRDLGGGASCTYDKITNICGDVESEPCTEPTDCVTGTTLRNGECVARCQEGYAFEGVYSNRCIECPEDPYHGIVEYYNECTSSGGLLSRKHNCTAKIRPANDAVARESLGFVCIKCNSESEVYDAETNTCVKKQQIDQYTRAAMKKCFACDSVQNFIHCVKLYTLPASERDSGELNEINTACVIKP